MNNAQLSYLMPSLFFWLPCVLLLPSLQPALAHLCTLCLRAAAISDPAALLPLAAAVPCFSADLLASAQDLQVPVIFSIDFDY